MSTSPRLCLLSLLVVIIFGGCGSRTYANPDGDDGVTMSCEDGTGRSTCCRPTAAAGGSCDTQGTNECWTACTKGFTGHLVCSGDGRWVAGLGLFPCDAGQKQ